MGCVESMVLPWQRAGNSIARALWTKRATEVDRHTSYLYLMLGRLMPEACVRLHPLAYVTCHNPCGGTGSPPEQGAGVESYWPRGSLGPPLPEDSEVTRRCLGFIHISLDTWWHRTTPDGWSEWHTQGVRDRPACVRSLTK
jgi:hypothetical protein